MIKIIGEGFHLRYRNLKNLKIYIFNKYYKYVFIFKNCYNKVNEIFFTIVVIAIQLMHTTPGQPC